MSYADRVRAGVALLDDRKPGWANRVDVDRLEMQACDRCVLGQLFGDFHEGMERLVPDHWDISPEPAITYGFDAEPLGPGEWVDRGRLRFDYRMLRRLWTYVIRQRQEAS